MNLHDKVKMNETIVILLCRGSVFFFLIGKFYNINRMGISNFVLYISVSWMEQVCLGGNQDIEYEVVDVFDQLFNQF